MLRPSIDAKSKERARISANERTTKKLRMNSMLAKSKKRKSMKYGVTINYNFTVEEKLRSTQRMAPNETHEKKVTNFSSQRLFCRRLCECNTFDCIHKSLNCLRLDFFFLRSPVKHHQLHIPAKSVSILRSTKWTEKKMKLFSRSFSLCLVFVDWQVQRKSVTIRKHTNR